MLRLGEQKIKALYLGNEKIKRVYLGNNLVFSEMGPRLPDGYTEVEYIQSDGNQYIKTDIIPQNTTGAVDTKITMDVQPLEASPASTRYYFGSVYASSSVDSHFGMWKFKTNSYARVGSETSTIKTTDDASRRTVVLDTPEKTAYIGPDSGQVGDSVSPRIGAVYLFAANQYYNSSWSSSGRMAAKLYFCQIEKGGALAREYIPCINPSGAVGLYDLVGGQFYGNSGTGALAAGPAI